MRKTELEPLHETICEFTLPSGLQVVILPKKGFSRMNVSLQVAFGSIDLNYRQPSGSLKKLPEGIAHFLEHMIFENEDKDVSKSFSMIGANINAYTTFNRTVYYFTTAKTLFEPLKMLLHTVFHPTFETQLIEKEKAIILSEIQMYNDDLEQSLYYDLMKKMYPNHSISTDIAGTRDSILEIDAGILQEAFRIFYQPNNCVLFICGDVIPEEIEQFFQQDNMDFPVSTDSEIERVYANEEAEVEKHSFSLKKDMKNHMLLLGLKMNMNHLSLREKAMTELKLILLLDNFFGKSSQNYQYLEQKQLINNTFDDSVSIEESFAHVLFFSETKNPSRLNQELRKMLLDIKNQPIDEWRFQIQKRKIVGQFIQIFNSPAEVSQLFLEYHLKGLTLPELIAEAENIESIDLIKLYDVIQESALIDFTYHS